MDEGVCCWVCKDACGFIEVRCRCCEGKGKYDEEDVEEAVVLVEGEGRGALEKVFEGEGEGEGAMGAVVDGE